MLAALDEPGLGEAGADTALGFFDVEDLDVLEEVEVPFAGGSAGGVRGRAEPRSERRRAAEMRAIRAVPRVTLTTSSMGEVG